MCQLAHAQCLKLRLLQAPAPTTAALALHSFCKPATLCPPVPPLHAAQILKRNCVVALQPTADFYYNPACLQMRCGTAPPPATSRAATT